MDIDSDIKPGTAEYFVEWAIGIIDNVDGGHWDQHADEWTDADIRWHDAHTTWFSKNKELIDDV